jgi:hypothetical protein
MLLPVWGAVVDEMRPRGHHLHPFELGPHREHLQKNEKQAEVKNPSHCLTHAANSSLRDGVIGGRIPPTWVSIPKRVRWGTSRRRRVAPFRTSSVAASGSIRAAAPPPVAMAVARSCGSVLERDGSLSKKMLEARSLLLAI